jgi:hypothetical protein
MPANPRIQLNLFSSTRQPINPDFKSFVRINNGHHQSVHADFHNGQPPIFEVAFFDNFGDDYSVIVSAKKHHDAGFFPVKVSPDGPRRLALMLLPKKSRYNFANAQWDRLKQTDPALIGIISRGLPSEDSARGLYDELLDGTERRQDALAAFHNIITALKEIDLPVGKPLDYFKQLIWEKQPPQRDRFFAFADARLVEQIKLSVEDKKWATALAILHRGATSAFKQSQFGEANVQLAFHESPEDTREIDGVKCVKVEADIDYFKDLAAHFLLEVIPNAITNNKTSPKIVYLLRWIAGQSDGMPEFNPPYTIEAAAD